ncbi:MAG: hypothetical protein A2172_02010 [Candidatus Woykebacteria bacterium RBG_13_40_15]|uniref:DhaL domain-containing protein n=1 Tax=Candidatus Woykebacteria bacterium RBG_13_40_15 TaxID=1802593 RepID=A0A1G1W661_9BACT|nr:MAG: hypothetical protein A2172_02010 [Candidatus Woykebacteria bacterium RBG_13_40_15]
MVKKATKVVTYSGEDLREMFEAATAWLERNAGAIDAINVFPVPDGDTGTNMYLTMRATMSEVYQTDSDAADFVAQAMARGALMGARGNSGVILSQALRGLADSLSGKARFDGSDFATALDQAASSAHRAVKNPVEGTILTVIRAAAESALNRAERSEGSVINVLASAAEAAKEAVAKTPTLLPILRDAGVVDAGGQGLYIILEGALRHLLGDVAGSVPLAIQYHPPDQAWFEATGKLHERGESEYGYCTEFLIIGEGLDANAVQKKMKTLGKSVLVVGDAGMLRVHVHTPDSEAAISYARNLGKVTQSKADDMEDQVREFARRGQAGQDPKLVPLGTVVVVSGDGLENVFRSLGVTAIVPGGRTMNPSTQQILAAIDSCRQDDVIVFPNNRNVILTAEQAKQQSKKNVIVVPTESIPQGIAAFLALNLEKNLPANATAMGNARLQVRTIEVTVSTRSAKIDGLSVEKGQPIALLDGKVVVASDSSSSAVCSCLGLEGVVTQQSSLVTIYYGVGNTQGEVQALAAVIKEERPSLGIEVVDGGQPLYPYIVSVE